MTQEIVRLGAEITAIENKITTLEMSLDSSLSHRDDTYLKVGVMYKPMLMKQDEAVEALNVLIKHYKSKRDSLTADLIELIKNNK